MPKGQRILLFAIYLFLAGLVSLFHNGAVIPEGSDMIVLYSALVMLCFIVLFVEHFFTKPTDVLASAISILLLLAPIKNDLSKFGLWYELFFTYNIALVVTSLLALLLADDETPSNSRQNLAAFYLKAFATRFGNGKFLFYSLFILSLLFYVDNQSREFLILFGFSLVVLLVDPKKVFLRVISWKPQPDEVGRIFSVQGKSTFLAQLLKNKPLDNGQLVHFCFNSGSGNQQHVGYVIDVHVLDDKRWASILLLDSVELPSCPPPKEGVVCILKDSMLPDIPPICGTVVDGSNIRKVRFNDSGHIEVTEGSLLELSTGERKVLYQVVQGTTFIESLESKNEATGVVGDAVQLGVWNPRKLNFDKFGWVPKVNTPLYLATDIAEVPVPDNHMRIGEIPNTNYPLFLDKEAAITHHLAILGVTGTGKSVFTRNIIREIASDDTRVIVVDFTLEHKNKLSDMNPQPVVPQGEADAIFSAINTLSVEMAKFPTGRDARDATAVEQAEKEIKIKFWNAIKAFLESSDRLSLFELPDVSNSTEILEYTKWFFRALFAIAKKERNFGRKVCVVLEEAHTVIPEFNFIGVGDRSAGSLVNSIAQIALQGRKYGVGFIVVAQRTANVSKTVLTQCNSIVAFQQFDRTSGDFLSNHVGEDMVHALPNLKFRQGIAVGKAFKASMPLIFEVPEIREPEARLMPQKVGRYQKVV